MWSSYVTLNYAVCVFYFAEIKKKEVSALWVAKQQQQQQKQHQKLKQNNVYASCGA